jgi:Domain of unknown function (DUF5123)/Domain of unknown function (DUF4957)
MKNKFRYIPIQWLLITVLFAAGVSCTNTDEKKQLQLPRQFKTGDISITTEAQKATLSWSHVFSDANTTYTIQVSKDSTFAGTNVVDKVINTTSFVVTDSVLQPRQNYYARVKTNASGSTAESGWVTSGRFSITGEQIFQPITVSDIIDNAVLLKWTSTTGLTTIVITPLAGGAPITINLTAGDLTAAQKIISGLSANTNYSAEIFSGTKSRGYLVFKTTAPLTGNIVDLRGFTGRPTLIMDTLPVVPAGSIVLLKRGETYNISAATTIDKTISIRSGADLALASTQANIYFTNNFNFGASATIDSIEFNDLHMYSDAYGSRYIFNTTNGATVGKMKFLNSRIEIFRGMTRLQSGTTTVSNYIVDNCVIDSLSNYGVLTVDNATCKADKISITNSTIYKVERIVTSTKNNSTSVLIDNCTVNEAPLASSTGSFIVDYNTFNATSGITITDCIFGKFKPNGTVTDIRDVRAGTSTTITSSNNYVTNDHTATSFALTPVIAYSGSSETLWQSPYTGNFKFADISFAGKNTAGDPRWK